MVEVTKAQIFNTLSHIDVSRFVDKIENSGTRKDGTPYSYELSYLSWSAAESIVSRLFPDWSYKFTQFYPERKIKNADGSESIWVSKNPQDYLIDSTGCRVECTVNICGNEYHGDLYVMDKRNKAIRKPQEIDQQNINKTKMRCIVKTLAQAGLGASLYIKGSDDAPIAQMLTQAGITQDKVIAQRDQAQLMRDRQRFNQIVNTVTEGDKDAKQQLIAQVTAKVKGMLKQQKHPVAMAMLTELERGQWYLKGLNQVLLEQDK